MSRKGSCPGRVAAAAVAGRHQPGGEPRPCTRPARQFQRLKQRHYRLTGAVGLRHRRAPPQALPIAACPPRSVPRSRRSCGAAIGTPASMTRASSPRSWASSMGSPCRANRSAACGGLGLPARPPYARRCVEVRELPDAAPARSCWRDQAPSPRCPPSFASSPPWRALALRAPSRHAASRPTPHRRLLLTLPLRCRLTPPAASWRCVAMIPAASSKLATRPGMTFSRCSTHNILVEPRHRHEALEGLPYLPQPRAPSAREEIPSSNANEPIRAVSYPIAWFIDVG